MLSKTLDSGLLALLLTAAWITGSLFATGMFGVLGFAAPIAAAWGVVRDLRIRPRTTLHWVGLAVNSSLLCLTIFGWLNFFSSPD